MCVGPAAGAVVRGAPVGGLGKQEPGGREEDGKIKINQKDDNTRPEFSHEKTFLKLFLTDKSIYS